MPRPRKNNADYFSHDADMRNHRKIKAVRTRFGITGYAVYNMLLEVLTESENNRIHLTDVELHLLSGDFDVSVTEIREIIDFCVMIELFYIDGKTLYSSGLDERLKAVYDKRKRSAELAEQRKRNSAGLFDKDDSAGDSVPETDKKDVSVTETPQEPVSVTETPQSKVNKSKVNKSIDIGVYQREFYNSLKPYINDFDKQTLREFYDYWSEPNKSKTKIRWQLEKTWDIKRRLDRWASNNFNKHKKNEEPEKVTYKPKS